MCLCRYLCDHCAMIWDFGEYVVGTWSGMWTIYLCNDKVKKVKKKLAEMFKQFQYLETCFNNEGILQIRDTSTKLISKDFYKGNFSNHKTWQHFEFLKTSHRAKVRREIFPIKSLWPQSFKHRCFVRKQFLIFIADQTIFHYKYLIEVYKQV